MTPLCRLNLALMSHPGTTFSALRVIYVIRKPHFGARIRVGRMGLPRLCCACA